MFGNCRRPRWVAIAALVGARVGAALGWHRGKMIRINVDPETGDSAKRPRR